MNQGAHDEIDRPPLRPYGPRVLVQQPPAEEQTKSGIILPPGYHRMERGVVIAVGEDVPGISTGDVIYYAKDCARDFGDRTLVDVTCILAIEGEERF